MTLKQNFYENLNNGMAKSTGGGKGSEEEEAGDNGNDNGKCSNLSISINLLLSLMAWLVSGTWLLEYIQ